LPEGHSTNKSGSLRWSRGGVDSAADVDFELLASGGQLSGRERQIQDPKRSREASEIKGKVQQTPDCLKTKNLVNFCGIINSACSERDRADNFILSLIHHFASSTTLR
jgi:hypothetical protein